MRTTSLPEWSTPSTSKQARVAELFAALFDEDPAVRMQAADAAEKITRDRPELLQPWKEPLLEQIALRPEKGVRWHVAQMLPRLRLTTEERDQAIQILMGYLSDESSIVKTCSMQALADFAIQYPVLQPEIVPLIERLTVSGTPAMRSRGRMLLKLLTPGVRSSRQPS